MSARKCVNCALCRNAEISWTNRLTCAYGHEQEKHYTLVRESGCKDYDEMPVPERIVKQEFPFVGDGTRMKNQSVAARRAAGTIDAIMKQYGKAFAPDDVEAMRAAMGACNRAGNHLEVAARLAKKRSDEYLAKLRAEAPTAS